MHTEKERRVPYHISLPRPMAARLDEAARAERRKPSNMVEKIIMDFFDAEEASVQAKPNGIHKPDKAARA